MKDSEFAGPKRELTERRGLVYRSPGNKQCLPTSAVVTKVERRYGTLVVLIPFFALVGSGTLRTRWYEGSFYKKVRILLGVKRRPNQKVLGVLRP